MGGQRDNGGGLSLQTLVIASLSSLAAALFIHKFWQGGAILGAAVTPVIVALVSEALRKPAQVITARSGRTREHAAVNPPPVVTDQQEDRFGIWEDQKPRRRLHVGLALATGLVAFAIAAFFLTGAELVLGGASDSDRFRVLPGKQERRDTGRDRDEAEPAPATQPQDEQAPEEEAPPEEVPETEPPPAETVPPAETTPPEPLPPAQTTPPEADPAPTP